MVSERIVTSDFISEITVRMDPRGGRLRTKADAKGHIDTSGETHLVLLIHGFAVNEEDARRAYQSFRNNLPSDRKMQLTQFFWPGDAHVSSIRSKLGYSWMPDRAEEAALLLEEILIEKLARQGTGTINLYIVAHSLGCRLTLETLRLLRSHKNRVRIRLVVLMAAAVPLYEIKPNSSSLARFNLRKMNSEQIQVHYSRRDLVLRYIFQAGQLASASNPMNRISGRRALGSVGLPKSYDQMHHINDYKTRNGHGGYWEDENLASQVAQYLPSRARLVRARDPVRGREIALPFTDERHVFLDAKAF